VITDILTMVRKEWREYLIAGPGLRGGKVGLLLMLAVFGVMLPAQNGIAWLRSPAALAAWSWVPLMLVAGVIADSFAGERERHTLETLLASRLPDDVILMGKVAAAVGYAWGFTLAMAAVGVVSVNVMHWQGQVTWFPALTAIGLPLISFLTSLTAALAGVLISLRAATARQAAQILSVAVMVLLFVPLFGIQALPADLKASLFARAALIEPGTALAAFAAFLALVDAMLLFVGLARFRRARLILD
jgi:ABC-2 type transport system permease protein